MSVKYNPSVVTSNLIAYFDAYNPKSYSSGKLSSIIGTSMITSWASFADGYLSANGMQSNTTTLSSLSSTSNVTFVVSLKYNQFSSGTVLSLYGDPFRHYLGSTITTSNNILITVNATSSYAIANVFSNTNITTSNNILITVNAASSYAIANAVANTSNTRSNNVGSRSNATGMIALGNVVIDTSNTRSNNVGSSSNATTQDIYYDYPNVSSSLCFDRGQIMVNYNDGSFRAFGSVTAPNSLNDVITVVYKKNAPDASIKVYLNRALVLSTANVTNIANLGYNLSISNRNGQGNPTDIPIRSVLIYDKELSSQEIEQIASAIKRI